MRRCVPTAQRRGEYRDLQALSKQAHRPTGDGGNHPAGPGKAASPAVRPDLFFQYPVAKYVPKLGLQPDI